MSLSFVKILDHFINMNMLRFISVWCLNVVTEPPNHLIREKASNKESGTDEESIRKGLQQISDEQLSVLWLWRLVGCLPSLGWRFKLAGLQCPVKPFIMSWCWLGRSESQELFREPKFSRNLILFLQQAGTVHDTWTQVDWRSVWSTLIVLVGGYYVGAWIVKVWLRWFHGACWRVFYVKTVKWISKWRKN